MQNTNLAPIILFVYKRLAHTQQTVSTLQRNIGAEGSELFIYSDGAKNENDQASVLELRQYLNSIDGFNRVTVIERECNYGLAKNIIEGVSEVISEYGKLIVLEDDLLTSTSFLCYMNEALNYYKNREDIFSISGYSAQLPRLRRYSKDTYLSFRPSSWGWGTWKSKWDDIDWEVNDYEDFIQNKQKVKKFNRGGIDMTRMLKHFMMGKNNSWAIRWSYAMFKYGQYSIYPKVSKVQNIGFGKDATHCSSVNIYQTSLDDSRSCSFNFTDEKSPNKQIAKEFKYQYSYINKLIKKTIGHLKWLKK